MAVALLLVVPHGSSNVFAGKTPSYGKGDPDAQTRIGGGNLGGPAGYAAQQLGALAYPSDSVTLKQLNAERSAFAAARTVRGAAVTNPWSLVGPTTSTQPAVLNFFDGQASDFQVAGRVTAIAVDNTCDLSRCRLWIAAAGGGIWRTSNALADVPAWTYESIGFGINAIGALTFDVHTRTLYAGTGEPNASGDSESGVGIYKSTDLGNTWTLLAGSPSKMRARSISSIVVDPHDPDTIYVGTARGVRGVSAVTGGAVSLAPDAPAWGLYKTTNGGTSFSMVWDGNASLRGINHIEMDSHGTLYAAAFQQGIWRSADGGTTWEQVFATQDPTDNAARTEFALAKMTDGHTRIYVGDGGTETGDVDSNGLPIANTGVYRADSIDTKTASSLTDGTSNPGYTSLTDSSNSADPTADYCETQCWYDNYVVSPAGFPDDVYVGGSFDYTLEPYGLNNGRGILFSDDAGASWSDFTRDAAATPTGTHPDQHALAVDPENPLLFFEGSDGGMIHSSGQLKDGSGNCPTDFGDFSTTCSTLLASVPTKLTTMNKGLSTLQFQGIVSKPSSPNMIIGGTQDNGTWLGYTTSKSWKQTIYGDGGVPAFDATRSSWSMNEFYGAATDVNFENGAPDKWVIVSGPLANSGESQAFYKPQLGDPVVSGTSFVGQQSVWRTQDFGGSKSHLEADCPEFTASFDKAGCGDFVPLGDKTGNGGPGSKSDLTSTNYGGSRAGGYIVALGRSKADKATLWVATAAGRVFISKNANVTNGGNVTFKRIDTNNTVAPGRFASGIVVDANNPNRAWISYTGYNENTPDQPGHVFQVDYNVTQKRAVWKDIDGGTGPFGNLPATSIAQDESNGKLYVGTDFGVFSDSATHTGHWSLVGTGLPNVEIADVIIDQKSGTLYAGTHGRGIWKVSLR